MLVLLGVPDRGIDQITGWGPGTSASMRARYLHVPDALLKEVAWKIADAIWGAPDAAWGQKPGQRCLSEQRSGPAAISGAASFRLYRRLRRMRDSNS